jgi:hypothetical protein
MQVCETVVQLLLECAAETADTLVARQCHWDLWDSRAAQLTRNNTGAQQLLKSSYTDGGADGLQQLFGNCFVPCVFGAARLILKP